MSFELIRMLAPYMDTVPAPLHFASKFRAGSTANKMSSKLKYDIRRTAKDIAFPVGSTGKGYHMNTRPGFSSKEVSPPTYMEGAAIAANDLMNVRQFGRDPYTDPNFREAVQGEMSVVADKIVSMIHGSLELMASQILTGGAVTLVDDSNNTVFTEDFGLAATHTPAASTAWSSTTTAKPLDDIKNLCVVIARDGKGMPARITMNSATLAEMRATDSFKLAMNSDYRIWNGELGTISRSMDLRGAIRVGQLQIVPFVLDVYVYDEEYKHPHSGVMTKYMPDSRYIIESETNDFRCEFAGFVRFPGADGLEYIGGRQARNDLLMDLDVNAWFSLDRTVWNVGFASRPLLIPVSIDTYGCGYTTAA